MFSSALRGVGAVKADMPARVAAAAVSAARSVLASPGMEMAVRLQVTPESGVR